MRAESFIEFLDAYGLANPPEMIYREGEDFGKWAEGLREKLKALRGPLPERVDPTVEVVESVPAPGHTRHVLRIAVSEFSTLPAYLLVPDDLSPGERRAGMIVSHGHHEYGIDSICGVRGMEGETGPRQADALHAVQSGYVVLAPAWWGWVARDGHVGGIEGRDRCNVIQTAAAMYGMNVLALHIQDGQAAIDALAARPEVDPERIGCAGNSYGGRTTMWLTVFDDRIKACIPAGCMNTFRERSLKLSSCGIQYLPGLLRYADVPEVFGLVAPRPMQLQSGKGDGLITPADRDAMEATVRAAYRLCDAEDNFDHVLHGEGHLLVWERARAFLEKHL